MIVPKLGHPKTRNTEVAKEHWQNNESNHHTWQSNGFLQSKTLVLRKAATGSSNSKKFQKYTGRKSIL